MNKLLIDDYPIQVLPKLAEEVGLNEAIFLQQLHYWLNGKSAKHIGGRKWIYNTFENWQEQFPFWSVSTIKRTVNALSQRNLIIKGNYNRAGFDKTIWYSINYEEVNRMNRRLGQNEPTSGSDCYDGEGQNEPTNTIDYSETTSETTKDIDPSSKNEEAIVPFKEIVSYLNEKANTNYRYTGSKTQSLIKARINEGFDLNDFKKVIDLQVKEWLRDKKMSKYLRPETLFGPKFESYLNKPTKDDEGGTSEYDDLY